MGTVNNDGADTIRSSHINFRNWVVYNGDDCISLKGNSTDIGIYDSECYNGSGIALGSIGQFKDQYETMERLKLENLYFGNTLHAVRPCQMINTVLILMMYIYRSTSKLGRTIKTVTLPTEAAVALEVSLHQISSTIER